MTVTRNAVLSINTSDSMNRILETLFQTHYQFYSVGDVYAAFKLIQQLTHIKGIIIDLEENCKDCLEFIGFIQSSKIYKKELLLLCKEHQVEQMRILHDQYNLRTYQKPFNPQQLFNDLQKSIILESVAIQN